MQYYYQDKSFIINRVPETQQNNLLPWNAADELMLQHLSKMPATKGNTAIVHDRFGFLSCTLSSYKPLSIYLNHSQKEALEQNMSVNNIPKQDVSIMNPTQSIDQDLELVLMKMPKSTDLFHYYLQHLSKHLTENSVLIVGFMTKYFSQQSLEIAKKYFEEATQTKAQKKARLLILKKPKNPSLDHELIHELPYKDKIFKQYYGVFSGKNIDYASQFFMENMEIKEEDRKVLDVGCGNGVLAWHIQQENKKAQVNLLEDNYLALESAKMNISEESAHFHFNHQLNKLHTKDFDLVVSNPPFHFEHENNIEISLSLFMQIKKGLKKGGNFQLVANKHLNYKIHLEKIFSSVEILAQNNKFIVYKCE